MPHTEIMQNYTVQVMNLSPYATEEIVRDFFSHSGTVESVELERTGEEAQVAFVTFKEPYAVETAVLLSVSLVFNCKLQDTPSMDRVYLCFCGFLFQLF